jgi:hypothetical protein
MRQSARLFFINDDMPDDRQKRFADSVRAKETGSSLSMATALVVA